MNMDAAHTLLVMMASAVVGIYLFKTAVLVLPDAAWSEPLKKIAVFL